MRIGLALSQDGLNFARIEGEHYTHAVFDFGKEGEWDALGASAPQVCCDVAPAFSLLLQAKSAQRNASRTRCCRRREMKSTDGRRGNEASEGHGADECQSGAAKGGVPAAPTNTTGAQQSTSRGC